MHYSGKMCLNLCPFCAAELDGVSNLEGPQRPHPGDFTICVYCCGVLRFDHDMRLAPSALTEVPMHSRLDFAKVVTACRLLKEKREMHHEKTGSGTHRKRV